MQLPRHRHDDRRRTTSKPAWLGTDAFGEGTPFGLVVGEKDARIADRTSATDARGSAQQPREQGAHDPATLIPPGVRDSGSNDGEAEATAWTAIPTAGALTSEVTHARRSSRRCDRPDRP